MIDHFLLRHTFGSGCTDVIRIENLKHIGSGVTHQGTNAYDRQCDNRENQMLRHIQNLAYTAVGLMHTAYNAVQVQPFQIDGENPFQNGGKEEGWQRNTD